VGEQAVDDVDRLVGVVDGDVNVHPEDQLAPRDVLHLVDQRAVAVSRGDPLSLEQAERMRTRAADAHALLSRDIADVATDPAELLRDFTGVPTDRRCDLEDGLHQLGVDHRFELVARHRGEHRFDVLNEVERLAVEQHVLLLDAERVLVALAEGVIEHAAAAREARAFARDRGWIDLPAVCLHT
jgi:hypothetical protein